MTIQSPQPRPLLAHSIPLVQARFFGTAPRVKHGSGKPGISIDHIVLHTMEVPCTFGRAGWCAQWMANFGPLEPKKSAHYYLDPATVIQGVADHQIAYAAPGANHNGIQLEHAGFANFTTSQWLRDEPRNMLELSVQLTARLCRQWDIPALAVSAEELARNVRGITTHDAVSKAFKRSDHHDPGAGFPLAWYVAAVGARMTTMAP